MLNSYTQIQRSTFSRLFLLHLPFKNQERCFLVPMIFLVFQKYLKDLLIDFKVNFLCSSLDLIFWRTNFLITLAGFFSHLIFFICRDFLYGAAWWFHIQFLLCLFNGFHRDGLAGILLCGDLESLSRIFR